MMTIEDDLELLGELGRIARELRYEPDSDKARLDRDELIHRLAWDGVSKTRIARAAGVDRALVYRIKDNYPGRRRRWLQQYEQ